MKTAILFAGQGSQKPGMGKDFYEESEAFRNVFALLPEDQRKIAFEGPMEVLSDTRNTQPCMVAFGAGVWALLKKILSENDAKPILTAGLSLGEYSALHCAGALTAEEAVRLVTIRAEAMYQAAQGIPCGMLAVLQLERELVAQCCREASQTGLVQIANYNCPGQIVIAGEKAAVEEAGQRALEKGAKRCLPLPVSGPFHTRFMKPAGDVLERALENFSFHDMEFPVVFNTLGRAKKEEERISDLLVRQVQSSVYFEDSLKFMEDAGVELFIEVGPGKALAGFVKKTCQKADVFTIEKIEDLERLKERLKGV